jgi:hypothetical protein
VKQVGAALKDLLDYDKQRIAALEAALDYLLPIIGEEMIADARARGEEEAARER